jgi:hypothetical protein
MVAFRYVTPGYFPALGIPIVAGRNFTQSERLGEQTPLILSSTLARRMFGAENPIGQRIDLEGEGHWLLVVGVAADVKNSGLAQAAEPEYYRLRTDRGTQLGPNAVAIIRTGLDKSSIAPWVRREIAAIDAGVPVTIEGMTVRLGRLSGRARFTAALIGLFAAFGLLLAAVGLYGVLSFLVAQRTREIGVRMALGATPRAVAWLMGEQALAWTAWGAAIGLAGSVALSRFARAALFHISPHDPVSLAAAVAVLGIAAVLAAWLPARRASGVDPAVSLREE